MNSEFNASHSSADAPQIAQTIDTSGTRCPIPMLRTKQALRKLQPGDHIRVLTTDPAAKPDFEAMLRHLPHELVGFEAGVIADGSNEPRVDTFIIRKG